MVQVFSTFGEDNTEERIFGKTDIIAQKQRSVGYYSIIPGGHLKAVVD